jgi:hypothetical protein
MSFKATSRADVIKQWQDLVSALAANIGDLPHLTTRFTKLQDLLADTILVVQEQATARAVKQDASRRLEAFLTEGQKVAAFLRVGVREQYGSQSEKLAEFHLLPRRRRTAAKTEPKPPEPEVVQPEVVE